MPLAPRPFARYLDAMTDIPRRLPHVIPPKVLVALLAPTYAAARGVDEEEAGERLAQALAAAAALEDVYRGLAEALEEARGPRTQQDALLDRLSAGVVAHGRPRAAEVTPAVAAALVRLDLEIGLAAEAMRSTLETPRARALVREGLRALGALAVKELLRKRR